MPRRDGGRREKNKNGPAPSDAGDASQATDGRTNEPGPPKEGWQVHPSGRRAGRGLTLLTYGFPLRDSPAQPSPAQPPTQSYEAAPETATLAPSGAVAQTGRDKTNKTFDLLNVQHPEPLCLHPPPRPLKTYASKPDASDRACTQLDVHIAEQAKPGVFSLTHPIPSHRIPWRRSTLRAHWAAGGDGNSGELEAKESRAVAGAGQGRWKI
ncbi:hypothetical protein AXG93_3810s1270 [Marchantia polymorpha subsp. ruderalis]|uniref:Uncharacterized protein n=1 Tax=Marchantia polymorpha subsp. ruderalis TaxID=1480154 RepID=A0A176VFT8_MARPO|nr:hypothetical protein AXG93_3810s1270 [Marchantia polymorpha subsp. ruderalis]